MLKRENYDGGIFVFYDSNGNFRMSLVYIEYEGIHRKFSYYKRFTIYVTHKLPNNTFRKQIGQCNFSSIQAIKEAFSVEPVTKEFYNEIQHWYFWALDKISFPKSGKKHNDNILDEDLNLIRLLTRLIFVWFLKEKNLISEFIFDENELREILKDFNKNTKSHYYYNAILQNLFFATLNNLPEERGFALNENFFKNKKTFDIKTLYRYEWMFKIETNEVIDKFKKIPFLNGGLFECLDDENIYIDGFSRNEKKRAKIPDYLFFQDEEITVDLSKYGLSRNAKVRGLINILKYYNFTIDENSFIDQEIALDPELLGKIFENLLACIVPETQQKARKATGSYYTPREIVEYMVNESIFLYLKTNTNIDEEILYLLLSYFDKDIELEENQKIQIINAIDKIKILYPACGSGAFTMGCLHKLVHILRKVDPNNKYWRDKQIEKVKQQTEIVFENEKINKEEREEKLKEINSIFEENVSYPDYARKLYLIENCIYGVDIQQIAIHISKLRFFISLILEQEINNEKENFGIRPLPNLETKFIAANSLISLNKAHPLESYRKIVEIRENLKEIRHKYFLSKDRKEKLNYKNKDQ